MKIVNNSKYVNFGRRLIAHLIDTVIPFIIMVIAIWYILSLPTAEAKLLQAIEFLPTVFIPLIFINLIYFPAALSRWGQTLGRYLVGIKVTKTDGKLLTFKEAFLREFIAKPVSSVLFLAGFWAVLFQERHQAWHDELVNSVVVYKS